MELTLTRCTIRPWQRGDEKSLARHANNRSVWINLRDIFPKPYTLSDARRWIRQNVAAKPQTNFAIVVAGSPAGGIGFRLGEDVFRRSAEIGFWLGETFWNRGIMTEAVGAMTEHAFAKFDLCRIYANVFEWNEASMRVLEKAGYTREARLRNSVTKDGRTLDQIVYAAVLD